MKNTIRTLLSGLTTLAVAISAMSFTALATENKDTSNMTELIISSQEAYAGDVVTVTVGIKNNPGVTAFGAVLNYDSDLEFMGHEKENLMEMVSVQALDTKIAIGAASSSILAKDAAVVSLTFKIPGDVKKDTIFEINWGYIDQLASSTGKIDNRTINGLITIIEKEKLQLIGNINSDNKIDVIDATLVLKHYTASMLNKDSGLSEQSLKVADVNKDGVITILDATLILQYSVSKLLNPNITWEDVLKR